jgi:hypothetical protein
LALARSVFVKRATAIMEFESQRAGGVGVGDDFSTILDRDR